MSKRKDIQYIRESTGLSYKEARKLYKESGEDLYKALGYDNVSSVLEAISSIMPDLIEAVSKTLETLTEALTSIDWSKAIEEYLNNMEADNDNI